MSSSAFILLALSAGAGMSFQVVMNSQLRQYAGSPMQATALSMFIGMIASLIWCVVAGYSWPTIAELRQAPWWCWLGGLMGTLYLCCIVVVAPRLGVALTLGVVIAGQVAASTIIDHFGLLGAVIRPATIGRLAGVTLTVIGVGLVAAFRE